MSNNCVFFQSHQGRFWINDETKFNDLAELVHFHSLSPGGLITTLTHPVPNVSIVPEQVESAGAAGTVQVASEECRVLTVGRRYTVEVQVKNTGCM